MPLVAHSTLPTFDRLRARGQEILPLQTALRQDIRELHIGLLNMMPDAALRATEQQFMRMVGSCNQIAQFYVHVFTIPGLPRSEATQAYIDAHYAPFESIQTAGLDALIITGANVANPSLELEPFWEPLKAIIDWASTNVTSVLCSCLATHALVKFLHGIDRVRLPRKQWGVYSHRITQPRHPLLRDINTRFDVPHSRYNAVTRETMEAAGLTILAESTDGGVHMAVSKDQLRIVYFQAHPEYDANSLLKEYKREVNRYFNGERDNYPPHPANYFFDAAAELVDQFQREVMAAREANEPMPEFPESRLEELVDNTWGDTGKAIFNNWLGAIYQLTSLDRKMPFNEGVDPNDPFDLLNSASNQ